MSEYIQILISASDTILYNATSSWSLKLWEEGLRSLAFLLAKTPPHEGPSTASPKLQHPRLHPLKPLVSQSLILHGFSFSKSVYKISSYLSMSIEAVRVRSFEEKCFLFLCGDHLHGSYTAHESSRCLHVFAHLRVQSSLPGMSTMKMKQFTPKEACIMYSACTPVKVLWYQAIEATRVSRWRWNCAFEPRGEVGEGVSPK